MPEALRKITIPEVELQSSVTSASNFDRDEAPIETGTSGDVLALPQDLLKKISHILSRDLKYLNSAVVNPENLTTFRWIKSREPLTRVDLIDDTDENVQDLIFQIKTSQVIPNGESIATRLLVLFYDAKEEDPSSSGISDVSLRNFYNFLISLKSHAMVKRPSISLTPDQNIYASWRLGEGRLFSIHFLPGRDVRFVVFRPNEKHPGQQIRVSGTATADTLMETVASHGVWGWISE